MEADPSVKKVNPKRASKTTTISTRVSAGGRASATTKEYISMGDGGPVVNKSLSSITSNRKVSFKLIDDDSVHDTHMIGTPEMYSPDEFAACFYSPSEYAVINDTAKATAQVIREGSRIDRHQMSYTRCMSSVYAGCMNRTEHSSDERDMFELWVAVGHSRRGLESWNVPGLYKIRQTTKRGIIKKVCQHWKDLKSTQNEASARAESLRKVYEMLSMGHKQFGQIMGEADAFAVERENRIGTSSDKPEDEVLRDMTRDFHVESHRTRRRRASA